MKILFITPSYKPAFVYGGPTVSVSELAEALVSIGHEVTVYTTTANGKEELNVPIGEPVDVNGVAVNYFSRQTGDHTHVSLALWRKLWKTAGRFDIINLQSWWSLLILGAAFVCRTRKKNYIVSPRGMLSSYSFSNQNNTIKKWLHHLIGRPLLEASHLHATTPLEWQDCIRINKNWDGFILPNLVRFPESIEQTTLQKKFDRPLTLGFLSRIDPKKGMELLFHAIAGLDFEFRLKIAGTGENAYIEKLRELAIQLRIDSRIDWCGWMPGEEKFKFLSSVDVFVLTSYNENFANAVIESLVVGTPVLVSEKVGLADYVKQRELGFVCNLTETSIREGIRSLHLNRDLLRKINNQASTTIHSDYCRKKIAENYTTAFKQFAS